MPLIVDDVIQVTVNMSLQGRSSQNVLHFRCARPIDGDSETVAQRVLDSWQDNIMTPLASDVAVIGADYVDLDSEEGDTGSVAPDPAKPLVGGGSGPAMPANTSILVRKVTEGGRASKGGRIYIMGGTETQVDGAGILVSTYLTTWNTAVDEFLIDANRPANGASAITMCVVSRPPSTPNAGTSQDVLSLNTSTVCATQRERMRR